MSENGFLTQSDKDYLKGEKTYDEDANQQEYQKRYRLRQRVREAIFDFRLLENTTRYEAVDLRNHIFKEDDGTLTSGILFLLSFVYYGLRDQGHDLSEIENIMEDAIRDAEVVRTEENAEIGSVQNVDININVTRASVPDIEQLTKRFEQREPLSDTHLMALLRETDVTFEEIEEYEEDRKGH